MIHAVLFDFDGVLTTDRSGSQSTIRSLAYHTGLDGETLRRAYARHNEALLQGAITHGDMWGEFCEEVGAEIDDDLLHIAFCETPLDCEMLNLVEEIHQHCHTALVTDNKADRVAAIFEQHHLFDLFDTVAISAEVGSGKSSTAIFQQVLEELAVSAQDCLFIDNTAENLIVPRQMGMRTLLFDDVRRDMTPLKALLQEAE